MKLLVIGGTRFVGRHLVEAALTSGHDVTVFHRGQSSSEFSGSVRAIIGDREGDLSNLSAEKWDAVIDTCGYVPRVVKQSAEALKNSTDCYCFISTISVLANFAFANQDESSPLGTMPDETVEVVDGNTYGPLKVLCEQVVNQFFGDRAFLPRPGIIVGPHDSTDRFTFWPVMLARGVEVIVPDRAQPVQVIDGRDLARFIIAGLETSKRGAYHVNGNKMMLSEMLSTCRDAVGAGSIRQVSSEVLGEAAAKLPLLLPPDGSKDGIFQISNAKARAEGLEFRPLAETARDTVEWFGDRIFEKWLTQDEMQAIR